MSKTEGENVEKGAEKVKRLDVNLEPFISESQI